MLDAINADKYCKAVGEHQAPGLLGNGLRGTQPATRLSGNCDGNAAPSEGSTRDFSAPTHSNSVNVDQLSRKERKQLVRAQRQHYAVLEARAKAEGRELSQEEQTAQNDELVHSFLLQKHRKEKSKAALSKDFFSSEAPSSEPC